MSVNKEKISVMASRLCGGDGGQTPRGHLKATLLGFVLVEPPDVESVDSQRADY